MSKGSTKAEEMTSTLSTESILITGESNWIQRHLSVKRDRDNLDVRDMGDPKAERRNARA